MNSFARDGVRRQKKTPLFSKSQLEEKNRSFYGVNSVHQELRSLFGALYYYDAYADRDNNPV